MQRMVTDRTQTHKRLFANTDREMFSWTHRERNDGEARKHNATKIWDERASKRSGVQFCCLLISYLFFSHYYVLPFMVHFSFASDSQMHGMESIHNLLNLSLGIELEWRDSLFKLFCLLLWQLGGEKNGNGFGIFYLLARRSGVIEYVWHLLFGLMLMIAGEEIAGMFSVCRMRFMFRRGAVN